MRPKFNKVLPQNLDEAVDKVKPEETTLPGPIGLPIIVPKGLKEMLED